jgi:hypothetical protein
MSNSSLTLAFDELSPPVVAMSAQNMVAEQVVSRTILPSDVTHIIVEHVGSSDALGRWSVRDAHTALDLAQVQSLQAFDRIQLSTPIDDPAVRSDRRRDERNCQTGILGVAHCQMA